MTFTATDDCGNATSTTATFTIEDNTAPTASDPEPITVACIQDIPEPDVEVVTDEADACSSIITVTFIDETSNGNGCEPILTRTYRVTDECGNFIDVTQIITVEVEDFQMPADDGSQIACADQALEPTPPVVFDNCGNEITPTGPVQGGTYDGCEGTVTFTWTYVDCEGNSHDWVYTYTVEVEDFQMPADEGITISCASEVVEPVPPVVNDNCGNVIQPTGPVQGGTYDGCEGTVTFTWNYEDCEGNNHDWVFTYTVDLEEYEVPAFDGSIVGCESEAVEPVPPLVNDNCGNPITPVGPTIGGTFDGCEGTITYNWVYEDCAGNTATWSYIYNVEVFDFVMPEDEGSQIACESEAVEPVPPTVTDNCGNDITPTGPVTGGTFDGCEGTITFTWNYEDCEGNNHDWTYTYNVEVEDFEMPADDGSTVDSIEDAVEPVPPVVFDNCGNEITPTGPEVGGDFDGCGGTVTYTWNYVDCEGNSHDWVYTYTIVCNSSIALIKLFPEEVDVNDNGCMDEGDQLIYHFSVKNTGNSILTDISITDPIVDVVGGPITLEPGEEDTTSFTATYTITADDVTITIVGGYENIEVNVINQATVEGTDPAGTIVSDLSDNEVYTEDDPTVYQSGCGALGGAEEESLQLQKSGVWNDENGDNIAQPGETITYTFDVLNTGDVTLINVTISDPLPGIEIQGDPIAELPPMTEVEGAFTGTYYITQEDIDAGQVVNQATVSAFDGLGELNDLSDDPTDPTDQDIEGDGEPDDPTVVVLPSVGGEIFEIYNGVTPNGDGLNDFFWIEGIAPYPNNNVKIFNRWGVLVWETDGYNESDNVFRGESNGRATINAGELLPTGTYFYILTFTGNIEDTPEGQRSYTGYLYINR